MTRLAANRARREFSEALNRVAYKGERIVIHRRGKDAAVLVSLEDAELLERLEEEIDAAEARRALAEPGKSIPWTEIKKKLGL
jgi:prevent-host-death family protein